MFFCPLLRAALPCAEQIHRLNRDAGQARVDHEPAQVLMALAVGIGGSQRPHPVGAVVAPDEHLLAVEDVLVALADRAHPHAREVGAGVGLREQLPYAFFAAVDRRQQRLALLVGAPDQDRRRSQRAAAVVVGRQGEFEPVGFLLQDNRVIDIQPAAAILLGRHRVEPAPGAQLAAQLAPLEVVLQGFLVGGGTARESRRHVGLEPRPHLRAEALLLLAVGHFKVHKLPLNPGHRPARSSGCPRLYGSRM